MGKFNYFSYKGKRIEKLSVAELEDLVFDLVNAFVIVKTPAAAALLMQDLLTEREVYNLAKRLRIAKLLLSGQKQEDIVKSLHCSFGTVAKVHLWLTEAGQGLTQVIRQLPKRREIYHPRRTPGVGYGLPEILYTVAANTMTLSEKNRLSSLIKNMHSKSRSDKEFREELKPLYKKLRKTTLLHRGVESSY